MVDIRTLKPGDRVRIVSEWNEECYDVPKMDKWLGEIMTVRECHPDGADFLGHPYAFMWEALGEGNNGEGWYWTGEALAEVVGEESVDPASDEDFASLLNL